MTHKGKGPALENVSRGIFSLSCSVSGLVRRLSLYSKYLGDENRSSELFHSGENP